MSLSSPAVEKSISNKCTQCDIELNSENWFPSLQKINRRICKGCKKIYESEYYQKRKQGLTTNIQRIREAVNEVKEQAPIAELDDDFKKAAQFQDISEAFTFRAIRKRSEREEVEQYQDKYTRKNKIEEFYEYLNGVQYLTHLWEKLKAIYYDNNINTVLKGYMKREMALAYKQWLAKRGEYIHVLAAEDKILNAIGYANRIKQCKIHPTEVGNFEHIYHILKDKVSGDKQIETMEDIQRNIDKAKEKRAGEIKELPEKEQGQIVEASVSTRIGSSDSSEVNSI